MPALTFTTRLLGRMLVFAVPAIVGLCLAAAQSSTSSDSSSFFQDDRIRVIVPPEWTAKEVTVTTEGDQHIPIRVGEVLSRGKYRVYLLTHYGQASGIEGGRFGEIAYYVAPWIHTDSPWGCFDALQQSTAPVTNLLSRVDLYFDSSSPIRSGWPTCRRLHGPTHQPVWFGSYFSPRYDHLVKYGFFLSFPLGQTEPDQDHEMAFTATVDAENANQLPFMSDSGLQAFLHEASAIIRSIKYR